MTNEKKPYPSRLDKKNRSNSLLNWMIGVVFALIVITGAFIFLDNGDESAQEPESVTIETDTEQQTSGEETNLEEDAEADEKAEEEADAKAEEEAKAKEEADKAAEEKAEEEKAAEEGKVTGGTITREDSSDPVVEETVINTSWEPVGTKQSGKHVSVYDKGSVDWNEKINAISYATGLSQDNMYVMMIKNGGGPQKSIGVVQSKDKSQKYRVHLEFKDGEGWKPVKMDVLKTLEGAY
ncbi:YrrS family protein [Planomicrobium chinense]|uniref:YrrS family protein n=1 Tax=Planococcus chinensis TaxID=272917 RepID=UPI001CC42AD7|nr:YrrS family protein [Planococcus chinensis]MBZ5201265.1 YrrS family protein [Planococcus chinensis]